MLSAPRVTVLIASPLRSYTGAEEVEATGASLDALLEDMDARFPGIRFRIVDEQDQLRKHMRFFVNGEVVKALEHPIKAGDDVCIVQALSGG
ncbi:MAG TPA: MoaD/ThiS family protein [Rhizomicrobium sp.]|nr:MoaD/ThiS family protein [Rhizomicrobium sp.]